MKDNSVKYKRLGYSSKNDWNRWQRRFQRDMKNWGVPSRAQTWLEPTGVQ